MPNTEGLYRAFGNTDLNQIDSFIRANGVNWKTDGDKWNLLHMALLSVSEPPKPDVVRHLIELGVDVCAKDWRRWTPLHFAARAKNAEVVKLLIDAGAEIDAEDDEGITPLHQSVLGYPSNLEIFQMFLVAGAKTNAVRRYIDAIASPDKGELIKLLAKYDKTTPIGDATGSI